MEHDKYKWIRIRMEFRKSLGYFNNSRWIRRGLKINEKIFTSAGEDNINSDSYKYSPEKCKLILL